MNTIVAVTSVLVCKSTSEEFNDQYDQVSTMLIFSSAHGGSKIDSSFLAYDSPRP